MTLQNKNLVRGIVLAAIYGGGILSIVASGGGGGGGSSGGNGGGATVTANFTATPSGGQAPLTITFDASTSTTSQGTITSYEWQFFGPVTSAGESTTTPVLTQHFPVSGTVTVRLTVRTSGGSSGQTQRNLTLTPPAEQTWLGGYLSSLHTDTALRAVLPGEFLGQTGTWDDGSGRSGTITFDYDFFSDSYTVAIADLTLTCSGTYSGEWAGDGDTPGASTVIVFSFQGSNCEGAFADGIGALVLQRGEVLSWGHEGLGPLRVDGTELFFTDLSEYPLKKIDTLTGEITPLAIAMRAITSLTVRGSNMLWTDFAGDIGATGCVGAGAVRALVRAGTDGFSPTRLAVGDFCSAPIQAAAVTDGTFAYWARVDGAGAIIERIPIAGGPAELVARLTAGADVVFAIDATHLYWTESLPGQSATIKRCPLAGCGAASPTIVSSATTYSFQGAIVVDDTNVYVGLRRDGSFAPAIARVPKSGGAATDIITDASARGLVSDGTNLYWYDIDPSNLSQIETAPLTGGTPTPLAIDIPRMAGIALGPGYVYWGEGTSGTDQNDGKIRRVLTTGGAVQNIKLDALWPAFVQFDPGTGAVIYADGGLDEHREQGIRRVTLAGTTTVLVKGIPPSQPFAVDATSVYVAAGFSIARLSRAGLGVASRFAPAAFTVAAIEADDTAVYWLTSDPFGNIVSSPPSGTTLPTLLGAANGVATQLRQSGTDLFVNRLPDTLYRLPKTGGGTTPLATNLAFPDEFVVDGNAAYVVETDARRMARIDLANGGRAIAASNIPLFSGWFSLAHDANALYLMSPEALQRYQKSNGAVTEPYGSVIQDEFELPAEMAVDANYLYWVENGLGAVKRIAK